MPQKEGLGISVSAIGQREKETDLSKKTDPKKIFRNDYFKKMVHEEKKKALEVIESKDYKTSADDKKRTIFNEGCGQRLQRDKLI